MQTYLLQFIFSLKLMQSLFWTLMHSLWQGIAFSVLAAIIIASTKKSGSASRYKLLILIFSLFIIASVATFFYEIYSINNADVIPGKPVLAGAGEYPGLPGYHFSFINGFIASLQRYENIILLAWAAVILFKSFMMMMGLRNIYLLKHKQVFDAGESWNSRLKELSEKAAIKKPVVLLQSLKAKVPATIGYIKPVILFPAAALTTLPPDEIEAILLHELAHIQRKDFLVNIVQRIVEIIFFFNPAVLWMSFLIKEERENCCDDIAVQQTNNKKQFIHALMTFGERSSSDYMASFAGRKNILLNRIRRIITNNNKTLSTMEKTLLTSGILVTAVALFSFSQHEQISSAPRQMPVAAVVRAVDSNDTVPQTINNNESKYSMSTSMDGKQYRIVEVDGKVTELYIDNVRIPDNKIADYNDVIDKLHAQLKENKAKQVEAIKAQKEVMKAQADLMKENIVAMKEMQEKQAKMNADQLKEKVIEIEKQAQDSSIMKEQAIQMKVQTEVMKKAMTDQEILMKAKAEKFAALADQDKELLELQEKQAEDMKQKTEIIKEQTKKIDAIKDVQKENQIKINQDLQKQIEQLKIQNEKLNLKIDSIYKVRNITPA